ncbi:hypothetical protein [Edaphobacter sp. 12200R-103]|uniref:hypothetical protein n=1 Tax=Edaphobacter sp. 12200R-103 TaxID=2703788 RepID=UPI00138D3FC2|nr:hypothetical protein [Edaphobacter sp. 12200R-103]QHS52835.1 hypothetical protein GWR55_14730 [Edaphobacter sp. 12200R-103]
MSDEIQDTEKKEQEIQRLQARAGGMLPGIAGIAMFMIFMTILNAFAALRGTFGATTAKYSVLAVCTLLAIGVFGLLRLKKWGWAIVTAGCLLLSSGDFYFFEKTKVGFFLVRALLVLVFFLYLVRTSVRDRLR